MPWTTRVAEVYVPLVSARLPVLQHDDPPARAKKPEWLKVRAPGGPRFNAMRARARRLKLATVCEEARCPNIGECWSGEESTATFMLMGEVCTRGCRFCAVSTAKSPPPLDPQEPAHIAEAVAELGASYVVLTSVNRDELPDGGAHHLATCLAAIHEASPHVLVEMLAPDFQGDLAAVALVALSPLAVFAHNVETVERLTKTVRDRRADYHQSLGVLEHAKRVNPRLLTKSSIMLGVGETEDEVVRTMRDLRAVNVDILTLGQYLRPTTKHLEVERFVPPESFDALAATARELGFDFVASGPLVRSSYRAGELYVEGRLRSAHPGA